MCLATTTKLVLTTSAHTFRINSCTSLIILQSASKSQYHHCIASHSISDNIVGATLPADQLATMGIKRSRVDSSVSRTRKRQRLCNEPPKGGIKIKLLFKRPDDKPEPPKKTGNIILLFKRPDKKPEPVQIVRSASNIEIGFGRSAQDKQLAPDSRLLSSPLSKVLIEGIVYEDLRAPHEGDHRLESALSNYAMKRPVICWLSQNYPEPTWKGHAKEPTDRKKRDEWWMKQWKKPTSMCPQCAYRKTEDPDVVCFYFNNLKSITIVG